jgi:hypothetical protein
MPLKPNVAQCGSMLRGVPQRATLNLPPFVIRHSAFSSPSTQIQARRARKCAAPVGNFLHFFPPRGILDLRRPPPTRPFRRPRPPPDCSLEDPRRTGLSTDGPSRRGRNQSRQSADGSRQRRAITIVPTLVAVPVSSPPSGRRRGVRQNDCGQNDKPRPDLGLNHLAANHFAECFSSSSPGRGEFFRKQMISNICSTDDSDRRRPGRGWKPKIRLIRVIGEIRGESSSLARVCEISST